MARLLQLLVLVSLGLLACSDRSSSTGNSRIGSDAGVKTIEGMSGARWELGRHYDLVSGQKSVSERGNRVEVVEFFWFGCTHCYMLESHLVLWNRYRKSAYVDFVRVPATWHGSQPAHARLYYTLRELGREDLLDDVFDTIHRLGNPLYESDDVRSFDAQLKFAQEHGISGEEFARVYRSPSVDADVSRAAELARRYHVEHVPTLIVNGTYVTDLERAGRNEYDLLEIVNALVASEVRLGIGGVKSATNTGLPSNRGISSK